MKTLLILSLIFLNCVFADDVTIQIQYLQSLDSGLTSFAVVVKNLDSSIPLVGVQYSIGARSGSNFLVYANNGEIGTLMPGASGDAVFMVVALVVDASKQVTISASYNKESVNHVVSANLDLSSSALALRNIPADASLEVRSTYLTISPSIFSAIDNGQDNWEGFIFYIGTSTLYTFSFTVTDPNLYTAVHAATINSWTSIAASTQKSTSFAIKGTASGTAYTININAKYKIGSTGASFTYETFPVSVTIDPMKKRTATRPIFLNAGQGIQFTESNFSTAFAIAGVAVAGVVAAAVIAAVIIRRRPTQVISA